MPPKRNIQPQTQDGESIHHHLIVSLIFGKTVLLRQECGNLAVLTLSSTLPLLIRGIHIAALGTWKSRCLDLVIDIAIIDRVVVNKFVKYNTKAGCRKTLYFEPLIDVVGGIDNATIIKQIVAYVSQTPNKWLKIIHVDWRQEKALILTRIK